MTKLIDFTELQTKRKPHLSGIAKCLDCKHEWAAVCPVDRETEWLECPKCGLMKGKYKFRYEHSELKHWACGCGNDLFHMTKEGMYCPNCNVWQEGWEDK